MLLVRPPFFASVYKKRVTAQTGVENPFSAVRLGLDPSSVPFWLCEPEQGSLDFHLGSESGNSPSAGLGQGLERCHVGLLGLP